MRTDQIHGGQTPRDRTFRRPYAIPVESDGDATLIAEAILSRIGMIVMIVIGALLLSSLSVYRMTPQYVATAELLLLPRDGAALDVTELRSRVGVMLSRHMIEKTTRETGLYKEHEVGGGAGAASWDQLHPFTRDMIVRQVEKRLSIEPVLGTALVNLSYQSANPILAAEIANAHIRLYDLYETAHTARAAQETEQAAQTRLNSLRESLIAAKAALEKAKNAAAMPKNADDNDRRIVRIDSLSDDLIKAMDRQQEIEAVLANFDAIMNGSDQADAMPILDNKEIADIRAKIAGLLQDKAILSQKYGVNHPEMKAITAKIEAAQTQLRQSVKDFVTKLRDERIMLVDKITTAQQAIENDRKSYQQDVDHRTLVATLEADADMARSAYDNFMRMNTGLVGNDGKAPFLYGESSVRVVSAAVAPTVPAFPQKGLVIGLSGVTAFFMALLAALVLEKRQNVFQSINQVEKWTGLPVEGVLPHVKKIKPNPAEYIGAHMASGLAETVRSLYMAIRLGIPRGMSGGRVVCVTSTLPDEGKTTTAIWLATIAAKTGEKVLIIDADMRRPSIHKQYGIGNARGLADYLSDRLPLDDVIYRKHPSQVHIMTSKAIPTHALTLLTGDRLKSMIRRLRENYDLIIIDAPTARIFADARVVATMADKTLYVTEWKKVTRDVFMEALRQFTDRGDVSGRAGEVSIVMNKVDIKRYIGESGKDLAYLYQSGRG